MTSDSSEVRRVCKSLIGLYRLQTSDEQATHSTSHENSVGFNSVDAPYLTSVAEQLLKGLSLTDKQFSMVSGLIVKYRRQIEGMNLEAIELPEQCFVTRAVEKKTSGILDFDGVLIKFIPNVYPTNQLKQYGFTWNKEGRMWTSPYSRAAINAVTELWKDVTVTEALTKQIEEADTIVIPERIAARQIFDYQKEACSFLLKNKRTLLALSPRLGKTVASVLSGEEVEGTKLVVCPKTLMRTWQDEIKKWSGREAVIWYGEKKNWKSPKDGWVITNYDTVVGHFVTVEERMYRGKPEKFCTAILNMSVFKVIIVDESLMVKSRKAIRTKAIAAITEKNENVWLLSGAPTSKFYDDLYAQMNIIRPKQFKSYWRFAETYCVIENNQWGMKIVANHSDAAERLQQDLSEIMFARTIQQVLDIPPTIFENMYIPMGEKQYKSYRDMEEVFLAQLPESDNVIVAPNTLAQLTRLIQLASNPLILGGGNFGAKWEALKEVFEYIELPAIVWTTYKETAKRLKESMMKNKLRVSTLTGDTPEDLRHKIVKDFQSGKIDIVIAHPGVGKYGLTLSAGKTAVYLERGFNGDDYYQSIHRIVSVNTTQSPRVIHLISTTPSGGITVDGVIDRVLEFRKNSSLNLTTGMLRQAWKGEL